MFPQGPKFGAIVGELSFAGEWIFRRFRMSVGSTVALQAEYKSPLRKLVRFFEDSRDNWKQKCVALRGELKLCKNQVRAVEKSRKH